MEKKYSLVVLSATVLLALTMILGLSIVTYGEESLYGQAAIEITEPEPSSSSEPSTLESSSGSSSSSSSGSSSGGIRGGGTAIQDTMVPMGTVTILDPEVPLSSLPAIPKTGRNGVPTVPALVLLIAGGTMTLLAWKGVCI